MSAQDNKILTYFYHDETKHRRERFARSAGALDWNTQPHAFRSWEGAPQILLPLLSKDPGGAHIDLYQRRQNSFWDFHLQSVGAFLELSLGLSAWKQVPPAGAKWALRMNPSSGNLHPTEAHLILPSLEGPTRLGPPSSNGGVYHYQPYRHALEERAVLPADYIGRLHNHFQSPGFLIALTSIAWREAWKYGERALRYCHHDIGHALGALSFSGNLLGWRVTWLNAVSEKELRAILGFQNRLWPSLENEVAELVCFVSPASAKSIPRTLPGDWVHAMQAVAWLGQPSVLSPDHVDWEIIAETQHALEKPLTPETSIRFEARPLSESVVSPYSAAALIRKRRSAVAFDGASTLSAAQFFSILDKTLARAETAPFDVELGAPRVHLAIFVHRVLGLASGLYMFVRDLSHLMDLKRSVRRDFLWAPVSSALPLFLLKEGDFQDSAARISCGQSIAGKSVFSLGMLARFRATVEEAPWNYATLFWECGLIGQVLYLEAEAHNVRGTGIGCFLDDDMHGVLGLQNADYQSLYHFTVGGALEDHRLQTVPAYAHLPLDRQVKR